MDKGGKARTLDGSHGQVEVIRRQGYRSRPGGEEDGCDRWAREFVDGTQERLFTPVNAISLTARGEHLDEPSCRISRANVDYQTVESLFILWKVTGDSKWRERGWEIFEAIEKQTKTEVGYASAQRVDMKQAQLADEMPSYFLAET